MTRPALRGSDLQCSGFAVQSCVCHIFVSTRCNMEKEMCVAHATYIACSAAKPLCTSTVVETPGNNDWSSGARAKLRSVKSAKLTR